MVIIGIGIYGEPKNRSQIIVMPLGTPRKNTFNKLKNVELKICSGSKNLGNLDQMKYVSEIVRIQKKRKLLSKEQQIQVLRRSGQNEQNC